MAVSFHHLLVVVEAQARGVVEVVAEVLAVLVVGALVVVDQAEAGKYFIKSSSPALMGLEDLTTILSLW